MPLILGANSVTGGYEIDNSLRFNSGSSDDLSQTIGTSTSQTTWTVSFWFKPSSTGSGTFIFASDGSNDTSWTQVRYNADRFDVSGYTQTWLTTSAVLRDFSAWYHVVISADSTQATASNRLKLYINGIEQTSFASDNRANIVQNQTWGWNKNSVIEYIGSEAGGSFYNGYMAEINNIDGQALTPSDFGEFDEDSGIWKPIAYTGTYGTSGFYLEFKDSSALGDDTSGNGNDFTVNNLTSIDQTTDTPTNNFATLNPLVPTPSATWSQGNLRLTGSSNTAFDQTNFYTIGVDSGKWYTEVKYITAGTYTYNPYVGVAPISSIATANLTGAGSQFVSMRFDNVMYFNAISTSSYLASSISVNDIIQVALDMDNGKVWFGKNGTFTGDPSAGTSEAGSGLNVTTMTFGIRVGNAVLEINSGNPPFTITPPGNSDANGYGNFEYAPPPGYYALCTKNLAEYG
jgi:hypothetical protein